jgi:hypothetical protein
MAEHSTAALAPFAAPAGGLNPGRTHAIAYLPRRDVRSHGNDLAHWLMAQYSGKWSGKMSESLMYIGVANAAGVHFHQHLIRSGLGLRNVFDLPRTAYSGNDCSFH